MIDIEKIARECCAQVGEISFLGKSEPAYLFTGALLKEFSNELQNEVIEMCASKAEKFKRIEGKNTALAVAEAIRNLKVKG